MAQQEIALIVGAGPGLSASLARLFKKDGMKVALAAREARETGRLGQGDRRPRLCVRCEHAQRMWKTYSTRLAKRSATPIWLSTTPAVGCAVRSPNWIPKRCAKRS